MSLQKQTNVPPHLFLLPILPTVRNRRRYHQRPWETLGTSCMIIMKKIDICIFGRYEQTFSDLNYSTPLQTKFSYSIYAASLSNVYHIKNAKYVTDPNAPPPPPPPPAIMPRNALIKFVRNAPPSLCWFRSDLTPENMNMLRLERPDIELLNWIQLTNTKLNHSLII